MTLTHYGRPSCPRKLTPNVIKKSTTRVKLIRSSKWSTILNRACYADRPAAKCAIEKVHRRKNGSNDKNGTVQLNINCGNTRLAVVDLTAVLKCLRFVITGERGQWHGNAANHHVRVVMEPQRVGFSFNKAILFREKSKPATTSLRFHVATFGCTEAKPQSVLGTEVGCS